MNTRSRKYDMSSRARAAEATRDRILDAATDQFLAHWYDDVTLTAIAKQAGVTQQTVVNHFGSKEDLLAAAAERLGPERSRRAADDPVEGVVADYELGGDAMFRLLALEEKVPAIQPFVAMGRASHRAWIEETFGDALPDDDREPALVALIAATDLFTWKLLRRDLGLSREQTEQAMRRLVAGALGEES